MTFRELMPLGSKKRKQLEFFSSYISSEELKIIKKLIKSKAGVIFNSWNTSFKIDPYPQLTPLTVDKGVKKQIISLNDKIKYAAEKMAFQQFSELAKQEIPKFIGRNLSGYKDIVKASTLLLFTQESLHILLLGDPGTGKTEVLRSITELSPKSVFGLGSGISGVGLTGLKKGKEFIPGLLPQADEGICCIDELNLMKKEDFASLLNAMEKGFVTYDKGGTHKKLNARVRILAAANPKGDRFVGSGIRMIKTQLPFEDALLSRFHLVFIIKKPSLSEFKKITKHITQMDTKKPKVEDLTFMKNYIDYAQGIPVNFSDKLNDKVVNFIQSLKEKEDDLLREVSPRLVKGIIRLAKSVARMNLKNNVDQNDLDVVFDIVESSYTLKK